MGKAELLGLLGGLALFLYGMKMMSNGLEDAAGSKMKKILQKLTSNRFLGITVGAGITAVIQSSSAATVMVVGFVNTGLMTLRQAVWVIMGANIGTTITGQLIALDVGLLAPLFAFFGVTTVVFIKNIKLHYFGKILAGLGILFIGMNIMSESMTPLRSSDAFVSLMSGFSNPFLCILAGAVFTAIIQSSSASIGILQTLAATGLITFNSAAFVLFGQNIGTCITAVLASISANRSAKRTTAIHLMFNIFGTVIFLILCFIFPVTEWVEYITGNDISKQIANMHTIFNITTTLLLLPFGSLLAKLAEKAIPDKRNAYANASSLSSLWEEFGREKTTLGAIAIHTALLKKEIFRIINLATENTNKAFSSLINGNISNIKEINKTEEIIDELNKEISQYISKILVHNNSRKNVSDIEQYFLITANAERIGDHALNIADYTKIIQGKNFSFSKEANSEILAMQKIINKAIDKVLNDDKNVSVWLSEINEIEQEIDNMRDNYREKHLARMRNGRCSEEACVFYSELLTDFERIGDHILNIAQAFAKIKENY